jgi:hypothetical protein
MTDKSAAAKTIVTEKSDATTSKSADTNIIAPTSGGTSTNSAATSKICRTSIPAQHRGGTNDGAHPKVNSATNPTKLGGTLGIRSSARRSAVSASIVDKAP